MSGALALFAGTPDIWPNPLPSLPQVFLSPTYAQGSIGTNHTAVFRLETNGDARLSLDNGATWVNTAQKWAPVIHPLSGQGLWLSINSVGATFTDVTVSDGWETAGYTLMTSARVLTIRRDTIYGEAALTYQVRISRDGGATNTLYSSLFAATVAYG